MVTAARISTVIAEFEDTHYRDVAVEAAYVLTHVIGCGQNYHVVFVAAGCIIVGQAYYDGLSELACSRVFKARFDLC